MCTPSKSCATRWLSLILMTLAYLLNQLYRYLLAVLNTSMAQDLHYGNKACISTGEVSGTTCNMTTEESCETLQPFNVSAPSPCKWDYTGLGYQYDILAGPAFIVVYALVGMPISFVADITYRKVVLGVIVLFFTLMNLVVSWVQTYWQLALTRFLLGIGEAGCTPVSVSIIGDLFEDKHRATAASIFSLGIYLGYGMAYAVGDILADGHGWRWAYRVSSVAGFIIGVLIFFIPEPQKQTEGAAEAENSKRTISSALFTMWDMLKQAVKCFCWPSVLLLSIAGTFRNGAGYVWGNYAQTYYESLGEDTKTIGFYMMLIPMIAGSIGVISWAVVSDVAVRNRGQYARILIIVITQGLATGCVALVLILPTPDSYFMLIPSYILGESWVSIALAVLVALLPNNIRTGGVSIYMFIITVIGGVLMPLLVTPLTHAFEGVVENTLKAALLCLYPLLYALGTLFFLLTTIALKLRPHRQFEYETLEGS